MSKQRANKMQMSNINYYRFYFAQWKNIKLYIMLLGDSLVFVFALYASYLLRFEFEIPYQYFLQFKHLALWSVPFKLVVYFSLGLYRGMWRFSGLREFWRIQWAALGCMVCFFMLNQIGALRGYPRSVFLLDAVLTFLLSGGLRAIIRTNYAKLEGYGEGRWWNRARRKSVRKRVIIIGAGAAGESILRDMANHRKIDRKAVAFLDDAPDKYGRAIHGIPVFGPVDILPEVVSELDADEVFIAIPSASGEQMRRMVGICSQSGVPCKTLPGIGEIIGSKPGLTSLREIDYHDLLGRPPITLDEGGIREVLQGKTILITGCGGSIGSELCRHIVRFNPGKLILVEASEVNLYSIQMELHHEKGFTRYTTVLGNIQDADLMDKVFNAHRPDMVFHAAAYKHVPMLERNSWQAVFINILGSQCVMEMSRRYGVSRFVLVSTDKAVSPTNVMGASKRVAELLLECQPESGTKFMAVRFGNVVGSSGSVIPLFKRQIQTGGPVTVTHPEVTRFFMTIPEAAQLILQAGALARGGEIFILEMGTPVNIAKMAHDLILLSGKVPGKDVQIVFTGLRAGEKLHEELITHGEGIVGTVHDKIMVLRSDGLWYGHKNREAYRACLQWQLEQLVRAANDHDTQAIKCSLEAIVPEYARQESQCVLDQEKTARVTGEENGNLPGSPVPLFVPSKG